MSVLQFPNGSANLTYLLQAGDQTLVLRRPPFGRVAPGAHDMGREYRVLSRLWRAVPAGAPGAARSATTRACSGPDFFVMEYRPGVVIWDVLPESMAGLPDCRAPRRLRRRRRVWPISTRSTPTPATSADLGRPDGFVARQVCRVAVSGGTWCARPTGCRRWTRSATSSTAPGRPRSGSRSCTTTSSSTTASSTRPTPTRSARCSTGTWRRWATRWSTSASCSTTGRTPPTAPATGASTSTAWRRIGLPTKAEITAHYARRTGLDVSGATWYEAFACWKGVVVLQQLYDRYLRGETTDPRMATRGERVAELADRSLRLVRRVAV